MSTPQYEKVRQIIMAGSQQSLLQEVWRTNDLGAIRLIMRHVEKLPERWHTKFQCALKQMSG